MDQPRIAYVEGVWFFGNEYPFFAWMNKLGIPFIPALAIAGSLAGKIAFVPAPVAGASAQVPAGPRRP